MPEVRVQGLMPSVATSAVFRAMHDDDGVVAMGLPKR